jgi:hypothetical protein
MESGKTEEVLSEFAEQRKPAMNQKASSTFF